MQLSLMYIGVEWRNWGACCEAFAASQHRMGNASSPLVDFHCHLDLYPDLSAAVRRSEEQGIFTLAVTTTPRAWSRNEALAAPTKYVRAALGLHPQLIAQHSHELELFESLLPRTRYVGEIGLDAGPRFYKSIDQQKLIFERIVKLCAAARDKVISVHSVRAIKSVLDIIERGMPPSHGRVVLHWFTGSHAEAQRAVNLGLYFSINMEMLLDPKRRNLIKVIPIERLLTETDGPFTQIEGRQSEPGDVRFAVDGLAQLHNLPVETMRAQIANNLRQILATA
jgi:TatD DNase family protein